MSNQRKQIIILAVAGVVLLGVILMQVFRMSSPGTPPVAQTRRTPAPQTTAAAIAAPPQGSKPLDPEALDKLLAGIKQVTFTYPINPGRDPMIPLVRDTVAPGLGAFPDLGTLAFTDPRNKVVSAIIGTNSQRYAVVDDDVVFPGYVYPDGVRVEAIHSDYVTFNFDDKRVDVPLKE